MKKTLSIIMAVIMTVALTALASFAAYPASPEWDWELPADGTILQGELMGTAGWGGNEAAGYPAAWDGDTETFFDPEGVGEVYFTGVKLDQQYILTEVRIMPRNTFLDRFLGATIQGSNDGENWTTLWESLEAAPGVDYQVIKAADLANNDGYSYYRYVNNTSHGDVAEVELYGNTVKVEEVEIVDEVTTEAPAEETPAEPTTEAPVTVTPTAPQTGDFTVIAVMAAVAALAMFVIMRKKAVR